MVYICFLRSKIKLFKDINTGLILSSYSNLMNFALCSLYFVTLSKIINNVIVTPCPISLAIRQSPSRSGHLTQHRKPPRFKG